MVCWGGCWECLKRKLKQDIPRYRRVIPWRCPLFLAIWDGDWDVAIHRLKVAPWEAFYKIEDSERTPLHLATMPGIASPSTEFLLKLIKINPHAVLVSESDNTGSTPIHFLCSNQYTRENFSLVRIFVETALKEQARTQASVSVHRRSPLFIASVGNVPADILDILVQTKRFVPWIAPWTGTETIEEEQHADSPLLNLWSRCRSHPDFFPVNDDLMSKMREIVDFVLDRDLESSALSTNGSENRSPVLESWVRIVTLFRNPCHMATTPTLLYRVSTLYSPLPDLVEIVCRLFPEQLLEEVSISSSCSEIPLHAVLRNVWYDTNPKLIQNVIRTLMTAQSESLTRIHASTNLYTVFLAASTNITLDLLFEMMRLAPNALQLQRIAFSG
ncbi:hypothetical protein FisN_2HuN11 [Fistulifera solaris]|uniref:Uncharacterized protein n=1 Tax=Fistulifera solaris TaxID=1519565 RepID=A0A1Z5JGG6_FISSO|nr:hypothetical protein FisN_2HuN11 [Fistulifera solaris]|eukprot:GAX13026.1 hypothetical protein FisN_2HuN11 [Fistulifera solaris]